MSKKRIFVSCGQQTENERSLGLKIIQRIEEHGMIGFFAEEAHEPADLNTYLFTQLQRCDGLVAVLQKRGEVHYSGFPTKHRASVWIQQEIAILFYRSFLLGRPIPMRIYAERDMIREGLITMSIINPIDFENEDNLLQNLSAWLRGPTFEEQPALARRESLFQKRVQDLTEVHWQILELIAAHSAGAGESAVYGEVGKDFLDMLKEQGKSNKDNDRIFHPAREKLVEKGLIEQFADYSGKQFFRIMRHWWDLILEEPRNQGRKV